MVNDLLADPRLRDRYAFWFFSYDSGNPIGYSGHRLRDALTQVVERADPSGTNPCTADMIVLGHSQGGLLTKLTAIDSGDAFWANLSSKPFDQVTLTPADREFLRKTAFVKPLPFVREVIFLATPQRGSYLAGPQFVRRLAEYLVRLPSDVVRVSTDLARLVPAGAGELSIAKIPTSIDNMSPGNRFIKTLAQIPVAPGIVAHSIISVDSDAPLDEADDGVVKYQSAHIDGVESELVVRSPHSGMQAAADRRGGEAHLPGALREIRLPDAAPLTRGVSGAGERAIPMRGARDHRADPGEHRKVASLGRSSNEPAWNQRCSDRSADRVACSFGMRDELGGVHGALRGIGSASRGQRGQREGDRGRCRCRCRARGCRRRSRGGAEGQRKGRPHLSAVAPQVAPDPSRRPRSRASG
jgi:hypothetical protein